ncbi:hypothetical protein SS1G_06476 [Sclerotinia sclerotiorum 1980 UF-70]|uniref:HTH CENPB-type domain-containing protein n=1 Tax=Sclerotinia sclerotiorum (strain ATCC 18683 / 1980 / Ss-1) TaxID=665079 RepID=A7EMC8_SCLS1|nr:hypothetical protein SS1G_06476 [Sclerotinia sclerotiorum 1980 UF-70]EDO03994.1 hypothetical protein SS1G_06476 [Sclerotinia sclerotiorum 1980 UF-70]
MNGFTPRVETRANCYNLTKLKKEVIVQYILDIDNRGFPPKIKGVEDMANYILESRNAKKIGKLWAHRFVKRYIILEIYFSRVYDFQRALCEDPKLIEEWFKLVSNMQAKYSILDYDFYNFDETGFMMGIIYPEMVATAIIYGNGEGETIPLFLMIQGQVHLSNWYTETDFPADWVIKPISNR